MSLEPTSPFTSPKTRAVILKGPGDPVTVLGKVKPRLTLARYHVAKALVEVGDDGLTKDELDFKSGHSDARKILKRLADSDPDWKAVIQMPGQTGRRYRIKLPASHDFNKNCSRPAIQSIRDFCRLDDLVQEFLIPIRWEQAQAIAALADRDKSAVNNRVRPTRSPRCC